MMTQSGFSPLQLLQIDSEFHDHLVARCGNRHLLKMLLEVKRSVMRYELRYMVINRGLAESVAEHRKIMCALGTGNSKQAARLLKAHWKRGAAELFKGMR